MKYLIFAIFPIVYALHVKIPLKDLDDQSNVNSTQKTKEEERTINPGPAVYRALDEVLHTLDDIKGASEFDPSGRSISRILEDLRPGSLVPKRGDRRYLGPSFEEKLLMGQHPAMNRTKNVRGYQVSVAYEPVSE